MTTHDCPAGGGSTSPVDSRLPAQDPGDGVESDASSSARLRRLPAYLSFGVEFLMPRKWGR